MIRTTKKIILGLGVCAIVFLAASMSQAETIIKLNLGGVGPDVAMNPAGNLRTTLDNNIPPTVGDQNSAIEYTGFLEFLPDVNQTLILSPSFNLRDLNALGVAQVFGGGLLVLQNFTGGQFQLFDAAGNLLLGTLPGGLGNGALTGVIGGGSGGTGALFTTTLTNADPASLLFPYIQQGSISLSMNLTNVNGGAGFAIAGGGPQLNAFQADASVNISAISAVPEPATLMLAGMVSTLAIACVRRRRP